MVCDGIRHPNHAAKVAPVRNPQNAAERDTPRRRVISAAVLLCLSAPFPGQCMLCDSGSRDARQDWRAASPAKDCTV